MSRSLKLGSRNCPGHACDEHYGCDVYHRRYVLPPFGSVRWVAFHVLVRATSWHQLDTAVAEPSCAAQGDES